MIMFGGKMKKINKSLIILSIILVLFTFEFRWLLTPSYRTWYTDGWFDFNTHYMVKPTGILNEKGKKQYVTCKYKSTKIAAFSIDFENYSDYTNYKEEYNEQYQQLLNRTKDVNLINSIYYSENEVDVDLDFLSNFDIYEKLINEVLNKDYELDEYSLLYCFDEQEKDGNNYFGCVLYNDNCHSIIQITRKKTMIY